jgi:hypothetical protein
MQYGLCNHSIVGLRQEPSDRSELTSQLLYGELFKVLEHRKKWSKIRLSFDKYEGWIDNKQFQWIEKSDYSRLSSQDEIFCADLVNLITDANKKLQPIVLGSILNPIASLNHHFDGERLIGKKNKEQLIETALMYLNAPYLWGGKTPFGIDCSGFTQMVYRLNGLKLMRDASEQSKQGDALSFIEESSPGDLAFFDNKEGAIIHVGIIMENNHIIHAHGKVRIDLLDHTGIYNVDHRIHSHNLRVIKSI